MLKIVSWIKRLFNKEKPENPEKVEVATRPTYRVAPKNRGSGVFESRQVELIVDDTEKAEPSRLLMAILKRK